MMAKEAISLRATRKSASATRKWPVALPSELLGDGEPSQQGRRNERVARQTPGYLVRQLREFHGSWREGVVAADPIIRQDQHERRRQVVARILPGPRAEISIERFNAADERVAVMPRAESLDTKRFLGWPSHLLNAGGFAIAAPWRASGR